VEQESVLLKTTEHACGRAERSSMLTRRGDALCGACWTSSLMHALPLSLLHDFVSSSAVCSTRSPTLEGTTSGGP